MKAKRCYCGGIPQYVYYHFHKYDDDTGVLLKRLECTECGATTSGLSMVCDHAVAIWNSGRVVYKNSVGIVSDVEETERIVPFDPAENEGITDE